jgi:hypothetical protein
MSHGALPAQYTRNCFSRLRVAAATAFAINRNAAFDME